VLYQGLTRRLLVELNVDFDRIPGWKTGALIDQQQRLGLTPREAAVIISAILYQELLRHVSDRRPRADHSRAVVQLLGTLRSWRNAGRISADLYRWAADTIEEALISFASPEGSRPPVDKSH
jgi:hypothetical protein